MEIEQSSELLAGIRALRTFDHDCDLEALALTSNSPVALIEQLVTREHVQKEEIGRFWGQQLGYAYVDLFTTVITEQALALMPAEIAIQKKALPLYVLGDTVTVAMADPTEELLVERLGKIMKVEVSACCSFPSDVIDLIRLHYSSESTLEESLRSVGGFLDLNEQEGLAGSGAQIQRIAESEEVIQLLDAIILVALRQGASDIHLEPQEEDVQARYRIDGHLREVVRFPLKLQRCLITRLKFLTVQDITEIRIPTDGRFSYALGTTKIDFRVSTIPSQYGEKAVMRILGNTGARSLLTLDDMKISQPVLQRFRRVLKSPGGIIFVTGPTGSGKTTTLYAALAELNQPDVNISTIEDPVELRMAGITQTQVQRSVKLDFAAMLRALLRQDPDIILIGEIRDLETAKIATEAALTGHLVLTSLHTSSAPEAFVRLAEIGVDNYMIAPTVQAVVAQRLAPRICQNCRESYTPEPHLLRRYFHDEQLPSVTFYRGKGCHICNQTGFKGRIAFHEIVVANRALRSKILERASLTEIIATAAKSGYRPMRYDGLKKVLLGLTTIEEIERQTVIEFV